MHRKIVAIVLLMAFIFLISAPAGEVLAISAKDRLDAAQKELEEIKVELEDANEDLSTQKGLQANLKSKLKKLNAELTVVSEELAVLEETIVAQEDDIAATTEELDAAQIVADEQYEAMKIRIKFMYEKGEQSYLDMILSSSSYADFLNKADFIEELSEYDREKLEEYQETVALIESEKLLLEQELAELNELHVQVEEKQQEAASLVAEATDNVNQQQALVDEAQMEKEAKEAEYAEQQKTVSEIRKEYEAELALSQLAQNSYKRDISEVTFAEGDLKLMASIIYCEAGGEPYAGQLAVGSVVINRLLSSRYPDTLVGVIYQNKQFSPVGSGRLELALSMNKATTSCYTAAQEAMSGMTNVGGCLYFRTPIAGITPAYTIGGHIFY